MSKYLGLQVGRDDSNFSPVVDGGIKPRKFVDRFYDIKTTKKQPNICLGDRSTFTPEKKVVHPVSYNVNYTPVLQSSPKISFPRTARGLEEELDEDTKQRVIADRKRQYKNMQDELIQKEKEQQMRQPRGLTFRQMLSHDSIVIGSPQKEQQAEDRAQTWQPKNTIHIPGGKFNKAERAGTKPQPDQRDYDPKFATVKFPHTPSVSMQRQAARNHSSALSVSGVTPESNRTELLELMKRVERDIAAAEKLNPHVTTHSRPTSASAHTLDFFLSGGRADIPLPGTQTSAHLLVEDSINEISGHSSRLRIQLYNLERGEKIEQRRQAKWKAKAMTQQQLQKYRLTNDYKLTKQYRIFQDRELAKLTEDLKSKEANKLNIAGSSYRLNLLAHQLESKKQATKDALETSLQFDMDENDD